LAFEDADRQQPGEGTAWLTDMDVDLQGADADVEVPAPGAPDWSRSPSIT